MQSLPWNTQFFSHKRLNVLIHYNWQGLRSIIYCRFQYGIEISQNNIQTHIKPF